LNPLESPSDAPRGGARATARGWRAARRVCRGASLAQVEKELDNAEFFLPFARAEAHYFVHGGWLRGPGQLLDDCVHIRHMPVHIVHGRYDLVCRPRMAWDLHKRLPRSTIEVRAPRTAAAPEKGKGMGVGGRRRRRWRGGTTASRARLRQPARCAPQDSASFSRSLEAGVRRGGAAT
jgi:hypothetical protein